MNKSVSAMTGDALDSVISDQIKIDFIATAHEIVRQVQEIMLKTSVEKFHIAVEKIDALDRKKTADKIDRAFRTKRMGLRELSSMARKELAIAAIRKMVSKYSSDLLQGNLGPAEYFDRFYKDYFVHFGIPASSISTVDPNLHLHLNRRKEFHLITQSLPQVRKQLGMSHT